MEINIKIMTWINRILMIPFGFSLLLGLINMELFYYSLLIAFILGTFQLLSFLMTLFYLNKIESNLKKLLLVYIITVIAFFISFYILTETSNLFVRIDLLRIVFWLTPVLLSVLWTYILESLKTKKL